MFKEIKVCDIKKSACTMFSQGWAIVAAGNQEDYNGMTVSWGCLGHVWRKDVANVYVRPTRYTYEYFEKNDYFTVSIFKEDEYKKDLTYVGKVSGRDEDKFAKTDLTFSFIDDLPVMDQAEYVLLCKKAYAHDIVRPEFIDKDVESFYKDENLHRSYYGVIEKVFIKE